MLFCKQLLSSIYLFLLFQSMLWCFLFCEVLNIFLEVHISIWLYILIVPSVSRSVVSDSLRPMHYSPPGSSVHEILQVRILEWIAIPFSKGSSWPRDGTQVSCNEGRFFTTWELQQRSFTSYYVFIFFNHDQFVPII